MYDTNVPWNQKITLDSVTTENDYQTSFSGTDVSTLFNVCLSRYIRKLFITLTFRSLFSVV